MNNEVLPEKNINNAPYKIILIGKNADVFAQINQIGTIATQGNSLEIITTRVTTWSEALKLIEQQFYDLLILDLDSIEYTPNSIIAQSHSAGFKGPIIVLLESEKPELIAQAMQAGAKECWLKGKTEIETIKQTILAQAIEQKNILLSLRAHVSKVLHKKENVAATLQICTETMVAHLDVALARIWTVNQGSDVLELQAMAGLESNLDAAYTPVPLQKSATIGWTALPKEPQLSNDMQNEPWLGDREWAEREGMVAFAGYPLMAQDQLIGFMALFFRHSLHYETFEYLALIAKEIAAYLERQNVDFLAKKQDMIEIERVEEIIAQNIKRERLVGTMLDRIRSSQNLHEVLQKAVDEVRQFLQTDRVVIYRFKPDWTGFVAMESVAEEELRTKHLNIKDECFSKFTALMYKQGRISAVHDVKNSHLSPCHQNLLLGLKIQANLVIPILNGDNLWGLLIAHNCTGPRVWQEFEIECLRQMGVQLAIALQQWTIFDQMQQSEAREREKARQLEETLVQLRQTQAMIIQTEKMTSLGQLVAGIAHEINNPINFIYGNISHTKNYVKDFINLIELYQKYYPEPFPEIQEKINELELDFLKADFQEITDSMGEGAERIKNIVLALRNFSRLDESEMKKADLNQGLESTLMILQNRLDQKENRPAITVIKKYAELPLINCYPGDLNQVFMNLMSNAIDAIEEKWQKGTLFVPTLYVTTEVHQTGKNQAVVITISDNGDGIPQNIKEHIFDPFFTTKPVGQGTGLGLAISHQIIVEKHQGKLSCQSRLGEGTEFSLELPYQNN